MIDLKGTMGIPFLKKSRFTGSDGALRFVLEMRDGAEVPENAQGTYRGGDSCLAAVWWFGEYCSDATPQEQKMTAYFPFDEEGLREAQKWLNELERPKRAQL